MEKSQIESAISKFKDAGITAYGFFCRGGNYEMRHNGKDGFIIPTTEFVVFLTYQNSYNNLSSNGKFEVNLVPYDNIDYIFPIDVDYKEIKDLLNVIGAMNDEVSEFLKNSVSRFSINTNSKRMGDGDILGNDGKPKINLSGRSAYIVEADADRRVEQALEKETSE